MYPNTSDTIAETEMTKNYIKVVHTINVLVPHLEEIISYMDSQGGWLPFNDTVLEQLQTAGFGKWSTLYLDEAKLKAAGALTVFGAEDLTNGLVTREIANETVIRLAEEFSADDDYELPSDEERRKLFSLDSEGPEEQQDELTIQSHLAVWAYVASLLNTISTMVHGRSMCQLVTAAINGDDDALCRAAQIDRTIFILPEIQNRLLVAQFSDDEQFLLDLSYRIRNPILKSKIRYKTLWITFAILDDEGCLDLPHEEVFDICEEVGVYGKKFGIEDVGHLTKRLREYRRFQRM